MDGAFVISADGVVHAAGRNLDAPAEGLTLSKGLGSRHWAAAAISKQTEAVAIAVSETSGDGPHLPAGHRRAADRTDGAGDEVVRTGNRTALGGGRLSGIP